MFDQSMGRRQRKSNDPPTLNLNSMMDMLSIILVFLLCNSSAEEQDFVIAKALDLPGSTSKLGFTKAVQVKLSRRELLVNDQIVAKVSNGKIVGAVEGSKIVALYHLLSRHKVKEENVGKDVIVVQADREYPFEILNKVLRTAAMAGFPNFRFAIQKE